MMEAEAEAVAVAEEAPLTNRAISRAFYQRVLDSPPEVDFLDIVAGMYEQADTVERHAALNIACLSGVLPDADETLSDDITDDLIALNRAGFLTRVGQTHRPDDGSVAFVMGLIDTDRGKAVCRFIDADPTRSFVYFIEGPAGDMVSNTAFDRGHPGYFHVGGPEPIVCPMREHLLADEMIVHESRMLDAHSSLWVAARSIGGDAARSPAQTILAALRPVAL